MSQITKEQVADAFTLFDADGHGEIEADELKLLLQGLGVGGTRDIDVQHAMAAMDDGSGKVTLQSFEKFIMKRQSETGGGQDEVWKCYQLFDEGGKKGRIDIDDLQRVASEEDPKFSAADVKTFKMSNAILADCMTQCSGCAPGAPDGKPGITYEDFRHIMQVLDDEKKGRGDCSLTLQSDFPSRGEHDRYRDFTNVDRLPSGTLRARRTSDQPVSKREGVEALRQTSPRRDRAHGLNALAAQ